MFVLCVYGHAQTASPYNVVTDEIMVDPLPVVGLPNSEFTELRNVSAQSFDLIGSKIGDASGSATISINFIPEPVSFVLICANSAASSFAAFGRATGLSNFPSLNNDAHKVYTPAKEGAIIYTLAYNSSVGDIVVRFSHPPFRY